MLNEKTVKTQKCENIQNGKNLNSQNAKKIYMGI